MGKERRTEVSINDASHEGSTYMEVEEEEEEDEDYGLTEVEGLALVPCTGRGVVLMSTSMASFTTSSTADVEEGASSSVVKQPEPSYHLEAVDTPPRPYLATYYKLLALMGLFYALPAAQFMFFQHQYQSDQCYFNFKCAQSFLGFKAFNNMVSNLGYVVCGASFGLFIFVTRKRNEAEAYGLHRDRSLYYCIALSMVWEGVFSSLYHICPSRVNYQFDTSFMVVATGLIFVTLFQKRHPATAPEAVSAFTFFGLLILISFLALTDIYIEVLWTFAFTALIGAGLVGDVHFYYHKTIPIKTLLYNVTHPWPPTDPIRLAGILLANGLSLAMLVFAAVDSITNNTTEYIANYMLALVIINTVLYMLYYGLMKLIHREKILVFVWFMAAVTILSWSAALFIFRSLGTTNKLLTPAESRMLNKPCVLFDFFDYHDIWHFLSALGFGSIGVLLYVLDFDIEYGHSFLL